MKTLIIRNKPLVIFFLLAFILAWSLMGMAIADNYGWFELSLSIEPLLIVGSWVPNIAAFLVIAFVLKKEGGIRELLNGWLRFRVPVFWYLATLIPIILAVFSILLYRLMYGEAPVANIVVDPVGMIALIVMITITGAMGEELGWRGFALPRLQSRMSALSASLLLGILWALWHAPLWFAGLGFEQIPFGAYTIIAISFTMLVTWVFNNTNGNLLLASLLHLSLNISVNIIEGRALYVHALLFLVFSGIVIFIYGPSRLSRAAGLPFDNKPAIGFE